MAFSTGVAMMGATMAGALAADMADFPKPMFIDNDGVFNGVIVVGENAKAADSIGATNIMGALQAAAFKTVVVDTGDDSTITVAGDAKKIEQSTNKLELSEGLKSTGIHSVTGSDLAALKDTTIANEFGTVTVSQSIALGNGTVFFRTDQNDPTDTETPAAHVKFSQDHDAYVYKVQFTPALKSDHDTNGNYLEDIRDKKLTLLGKEFTIQRADHTSPYYIKLILMGGSKTETLEEGEEKVVTVGDKEYRVKADYIGATTARFIVNGETTNSLQASETEQLADGTDIGVKTILAQNLAESGQGDKVEFYLGANKVELEDAGTFSANTTVGTVKVNGQSLDWMKLSIKSNLDGMLANDADTSISAIEINMTPDDDIYLAEGETMSAVADALYGKAGNMFLDGFDFEFKGLEVGDTEDITIVPSGSNSYRVKFKNKDQNQLNMDTFSWHSGSGLIMLGELSGSTLRPIKVNNGGTVNLSKNEYGMIGDGVEYGYGYVVKFTGQNNADNLYKIKDMFSGETYEVNYDATGAGTLTLQGTAYAVTGGADSTNDIVIGTSRNYIYTEYGAKLTFTNVTPMATMTLQSEPTEDSSVRDTMTVNFTRDNSSSKLQINSMTGFLDDSQASGTGIKDGDKDVYIGYSTRFGVYNKYDQPTTGQYDATWTYPDDQVTAAFFVTSGATSSGGSGGDITTKEPVPIPVTAVKYDTEVSDITAVNAIVVGGPCVNSAAKTLMGDPDPCAKDFQPNHAKIKLYMNGDNVAMLVAGYSAMDTRRAAHVLAKYTDWATQLTGDEVDVSGTTLSDISVGVPVPVVDDTVVDDTVDDDTVDDDTV